MLLIVQAFKMSVWISRHLRYNIFLLGYEIGIPICIQPRIKFQFQLCDFSVSNIQSRVKSKQKFRDLSKRKFVQQNLSKSLSFSDLAFQSPNVYHFSAFCKKITLICARFHVFSCRQDHQSSRRPFFKHSHHLASSLLAHASILQCRVETYFYKSVV